ncbi:HNH endonuclease [Bowdeniella massiliensis]|uniref:HNH endonuclease n=1 Tax=Bowdeniella massiliensis TaxID=2932264 RepID=UPI0020292970|nr:HNH endonuclease signature motif containing protein [Bowdeniella massiliensis]
MADNSESEPQSGHSAPQAVAVLDEQLGAACASAYRVAFSALSPAIELATSFPYVHTSTPTNLQCLNECIKVSNRADAQIVRHIFQVFEKPTFVHKDRFGVVDATPEVIAAETGMSTYKVRQLRDVGSILQTLPLCSDQFDQGLVSLSVIRAVTSKLSNSAAQVCLAVDAALAPRLATLSPNAAAKEVSDLLIEIAPDEEDKAHVRASAKRCVSRPVKTANGMAKFWINMPAEQALALDSVLNELAHSAIRNGDCRTYPQLRADLLAEIMVKVMSEGFATETTCGEPFVIPPMKISVTIPFEVLARANPDWDPHPNSADGVLGDDVSMDEGEIKVLDDLEHVILGPVTINDAVYGPGASVPQYPAPAPIAREDAEASASPCGRIESAWLEGYGAIPPALAILLSAGGTWQRIVTDTLTGQPLDIGRERYRPPAAIETAVKRRDRFCQGPRCGRPTGRFEMDHVIEWQDGGDTSVRNLMLLCHRCHSLKTRKLARLVTVYSDGTRVWQIGSARSVESPRRPFRRRYSPPDDEDPPPF